MIDSNAVRAAVALTGLSLASVVISATDAALTLRATVPGTPASGSESLTIDLRRWSTEAERAPLLSALLAPAVPPPPAAQSRGAPPAGRAGGAGRGATPTPTPSPMARLTAAVKAAPTVGFIWGDGPTGYSVRYAWRSQPAAGSERIVLVTDRRVGANRGQWQQATGGSVESEFTLFDIRLDGQGHGEGKISYGTDVVADSTAGTLALDGSGAVTARFEVVR